MRCSRWSAPKRPPRARRAEIRQRVFSPMTRPTAFAPTLALLLALQACATLPADNARLVQAHADHRSALADACARERAVAELNEATAALARADAAWHGGATTAVVDHLAYLARQRVALAREIGQRGCTL